MQSLMSFRTKILFLSDRSYEWKEFLYLIIYFYKKKIIKYSSIKIWKNTEKGKYIFHI